jgi:hypothetical protein
MPRAYAHTLPSGRVVFFTSRVTAEGSRRAAGGGVVEALDLPSTLVGWIDWLNERERATEPQAPSTTEPPIDDDSMVALQRRVIENLQRQLDAFQSAKS